MGCIVWTVCRPAVPSAHQEESTVSHRHWAGEVLHSVGLASCPGGLEFGRLVLVLQETPTLRLKPGWG